MSEQSTAPGGSRAGTWVVGLSLAYLFWCVFLGGFPLRGTLPDALISGKVAVVVFVACVLLQRGALWGTIRAHWLEGAILVLLLGIAGLLRFHRVDESAAWGPTIDEPLIVIPVLRMMRTGNLDTLTYEYGGAWFYFLLAIYILTTIRLISGFRFKEASLIPNQAYYVAGRFATALLSLATVAVAYATARRFFGKLPAIVAAGILALSSVSFTNAHQIRLDVSLALFVLAAHYFLLRILEEDSTLNYFLAGVFCGLSLATKYTVLPLVASLLLAHVMARKGSRWLDWKILLSLAAVAGVFLFFNFFAFAHLDRYLERLPRAVYHNLSPAHWSANENRPFLYFTILISQGIGVVALIPALYALVHAVFARDNRLLLLWCFPILLLALMGSYPSGFPRYLLPVIPVLAILAGAGTQLILERISARFPRFERRKGAMAVAAVALIVAIPAATAVSYWFESGRVLRPETVVNWVRDNVPEGATIIVDPTGPMLPEDRYKLTALTYRDFQNPKNLRDAEYVCVSEDLFPRIPAQFRVLQEFPARTKSLDRTFRVYGR